MKRLALVLASMGLWLGCGDDGGSSDTEGSTSDDSSGGVCTPGVPVPCMCADGSMGQQECFGGTELGSCTCTPGTSSTTDPTTSSTTDGSSTSDGTSTTDDTTSSTGDGTSTGVDTETTGGIEPGCGNEVVEEDLGEQCDDGNDDDADACSNACIASCGMESLDVIDAIAGPGRAAAVDGSGNIVLATARDDGNLAVQRFAPDGTEQWSVNFDLDGTANPALPVAVATFGTDSIFIGGQVGTLIFVHHLTGTGTVATGTWPQTVGGTASALATDSTGDAIVVGWLDAGGAGDNVAARKYAPDGTFPWTFNANAGGGENDDRGRAVAVDSNDGVWLGIDVSDGTNWTTRIARLPAQDTSPITATLTATGPLVTGDGLPPSRTVRGIVNTSNDTAVVAVSTDPGQAANTWEVWLAERDNTGTALSLVSGSDLALVGAEHAITGIGIDGSDQISIVGTVDDGGAGILTARINAAMTAALCSRSTQDAMLGGGFTVGIPGFTAGGGMAVTGGTGGTVHPYLATFRP